MEPAAPTRRRHRGRWILVTSVIGAVSVLTALFAFGLSRDPTVIRSPLINRPAPNFSLPTLDGSQTVSLARLRGQVVVVNFWASWCADCRLEHPALYGAWQRYQDRGVVVLGIPFEDSPANALAWQRAEGGGWPQLSDPNSATAVGFGVYGVPETFVIGPGGNVAFKQVGPVSYSALTEWITRLLEAR
jgi:cytochrome c biogenesis protein CcmG/thiol:disulfide interchange protein DsbE